MNFKNVSENQKNSASVSLLIQKKLFSNSQEILQNGDKQKQNDCVYEVETNELSGSRKKNKKTAKKHHSKSPSKKKLSKSQIRSSLKKLTSKSKEKQTYNENLLQKMIRIQQKPRQDYKREILPLKQSERTNIFDMNMTLNSFDEENAVDEFQKQSHIFGCLEDYLKDPQKIQLKNHKFSKNQSSFDKVPVEFSRYQDSKIGDRFLSRVIRKNIEAQKQEQPIKLPLIKSQIKLQNQSKNVEYTKKKNKESLNRNIFHNVQLSNLLAERSNSLSEFSKQSSMNTKTNCQHPKLFRIKTEVIHKLSNSSVEKQLSEMKKLNEKQILPSITSDFIPYKFIPTCSSSLGYYVNSKSEKISSEFLSSETIHQCYENLSCKSKKLLRLSLIRNPNLSCLQNKSKKIKYIENQLLSLKEFVVKEKSKLKLPLVANGFSLQQQKQKKSVSQKPSIMGSIYKYKKTSESKEKIDLSKVDSKTFIKYSKQLQTQNIKGKLRSYTEQNYNLHKGYTENFQQKLSSESSDNLTSGYSLNLKNLKNSISTNILQNFHERYNKDPDLQNSSNHKISNLNFSEDSIRLWNDSHIGWQHKKKFIVKKLGFNI